MFIPIINYIIYVHILYISVCIKSLAGIRPANASIKQKPSLKEKLIIKQNPIK